ncbi:MAG TPA: aldo/keto reductase, partial [Thiotrichales bacterium]|nr:aldo/keto reductase [Thiotrichales bacterium]
MIKRPLGATGIDVSVLGLGTVKIGRNEQVKYPEGFEIPDDRAVAGLFEQARSLGINFIDTAPAYGSSEQR